MRSRTYKIDTAAQRSVQNLDALLGLKITDPDSKVAAPTEIFRAALPQALPFGFHGNFLPAAQRDAHNK